MKLVVTSDCHGMLNRTVLPPGDVLILAGDILRNRFSKPDLDAIAQLDDLADLDSLCGTLDYKHVLLIAGNHDWVFERRKEAVRSLRNITYLEDSGLVIDGIRFYGTPYQPEFYAWAFNLPRGGSELARIWSKIPADTDVLITHGPPLGILDRPFDKERHAGCELLLKRVEEIKPKVHIFGHIHAGYGRLRQGETLFLNASLCNEEYQPVNPPLTVELNSSGVVL
jgi:Icc-related predicted phosphoesterase